MSNQKKRVGFTQNGDVMVLRDESPVLSVTKDKDLRLVLDTAINFLRCDNPSVQIHIHRDWLDGNGDHGNSIRMAESVDGIVSGELGAISQPDENFEHTEGWYGVDRSHRIVKSLPDKRFSDVTDIYIDITRTVALKTEDAAAEDLVKDDEFFDHEGNRNLVVNIHGCTAAVPLEGMSKHIVWWPHCSSRVRKIIK